MSSVIDNEFRHNIVKVVCGSTRLNLVPRVLSLPREGGERALGTRLHSAIVNVMTKFMINNRTDA